MARLLPMLVVGLLLGASAPSSQAAPPSVPASVSYQGVLLDGAGLPRTGSVDLTLRLYDAATGGTLVYKQGFSAVPLTDGVFTVQLGPSGDATDTPTDPLTTDLVAALAGDVGPTGPSRFLAVTVGSEGPLARTQLLVVPYALRATSAVSADTAQSASEALTVGGLSADVVSELYEHTNLDGTGPGNADASEGLADVDGDGIANFVDPDNDGDGLDDGLEVAQGSDINLVTPVIASFAPLRADGFVSSTVTVSGSNFEPGMGVQFGPENPTPSNLTSNGFDVQVGPQPPGFVTVTVTRLNGEQASTPFEFFYVEPVIDSVSPGVGTAVFATSVTVNGQNFVPGLSVVFGSQTPTPTNVTNTSFDVTVGPQPAGLVDVQVTLPNGNSVTAPGLFEFSADVVHPVAVSDETQLSFDLIGGTSTTLVGGTLEYAVDTNDDFAPDLVLPLATNGGAVTFPGQLAVAFDPTGAVVGLRCRSASNCDVEYLRDADGDRDLEDETPVVIESLNGAAKLWSPSIAFDPAGRPALGYLANTFSTEATVAHDRDGDGLFTGTNELVTIEMVGGLQSMRVGELDVDSTGRVGFAYFRQNSNALRVAWDRSGDGDFDDSPGGVAEVVDVETGLGLPRCVGARFDDADRLAVVWSVLDTVETARDLDGDGDFDDPGERMSLGGAGTTACDLAFAADGTWAVVHDGDGLRLLVDDSGDGDFDDPGESILLEADGSESLEAELILDGSNGVVATEDVIYVTPLP
ncbi:MAG: IPT/TIG domain-containing protein [Myxococcota bacterium]|nr:IPT/TIG domain-containing protein [Myxococcota bacterium]